MGALRAFAFAATIMAPGLLSAQQSAAIDKPTVAIIKISVVGIGTDAKGFEDALLSMLATELGNKPQIQLIERQQVNDILARQQLMLSGRMSDEDALRAGKLIGAQYIVMGGVTLDPRTARLDLRIVDPETSVPIKLFKKSGPKDNLIELVEQAAAEFTSDLKLVNRRVAAEAPPISAVAMLAYSRGLDYEKRGRKDLAAKQYQKALEHSPGYTDAKTALERVR
jgi:TolB-like protein